MYWDIVEVTPKPDYSQFVRFKDGLEGLVRLREEQLSGVLAALKDRQFFERVFIDQGAALGRVTSIWLQTPCTPKFRANGRKPKSQSVSGCDGAISFVTKVRRTRADL